MTRYLTQPTAAQIDTLRMLRAYRASLQEVADALGITYNQASYLRRKYCEPYFRWWTHKEKEMLAECFEQGKNAKEAASVLNRPLKTVEVYYSALRKERKHNVNQ